MKAVEKKDLQQFPELIYVDLSRNELELLLGDLFEANPKIHTFDFGYNQISHIGHSLVTNLKRLRTAYLKRNRCIDKRYEQSDVASLTVDLIANCPEPTQESLPTSTAEEDIQVVSWWNKFWSLVKEMT
jgi:Leucine-rich repeat (LRR) protein